MPKRFSPDTIEAIANDIKAGLSSNVIVNKHKISKGAYYRWSKRLAKGIKAQQKTEAKANPAPVNGSNGHVNGFAARSKAAVLKLINDRLEQDEGFRANVTILLLE